MIILYYNFEFANSNRSSKSDLESSPDMLHTMVTSKKNPIMTNMMTIDTAIIICLLVKDSIYFLLDTSKKEIK